MEVSNAEFQRQLSRCKDLSDLERFVFETAPYPLERGFCKQMIRRGQAIARKTASPIAALLARLH